MSEQDKVNAGHVFISYVSEDEEAVNRLAGELREAGVNVWLDRDRLLPGMRWETAIRQAIEGGTAFIACFSASFDARERSHMYEELTIAIDELRKRPKHGAWFLPVLLDPDVMPDRSIDGVDTLDKFHYVKLYADWDSGVRKLLEVIGPKVEEKSAQDAEDEVDRSAEDGLEEVLAAEKGKLARPVSATYLSRRDLFGGVVDATLGIVDHSLARGEIMRRLHSANVLPARFLYETPAGAESWLRLCEDPTNRGYSEALRFWKGSTGAEVARLIVSHLSSKDFDYVSLGPGDGQKDAAIVAHWLRSGAEVTYYPYDVSMSLLSRAIGCVLEGIPSTAKDQLYVRAVLADFNQSEMMSLVFGQRSTPNVAALLGNSIGNLDRDLEFLWELAEKMFNGDLLVLEAPLESGGNSIDEYHSSAELEFYFGPLSSLGAPFDPARVGFRLGRSRSLIPGASTCVVSYSEVELDGARYMDVPLAYIHRYAEADLLATLGSIGFEVLSTHLPDRGHQSLVCVARKAVST